MTLKKGFEKKRFYTGAHIGYMFQFRIYVKLTVYRARD